MIKASVYLFLFSFLGIVAKAQMITWSHEHEVVDIGPKILILEDSESRLSINDVSDPVVTTRFYSSRNHILHFGFNNSIHWLKFDFQNMTVDSVWLQLGHAFIPYATLYYQQPFGAWATLKSGYKIPLDQKAVIDHDQIFPLPPGKHTFFIKLQAYVHAIPIEIWDVNRWQLKAAKLKIIYGTYVGILLFVILANIFFFFALRKLYYLNYSILVFLYLCTSAMVMEGYAVYLFPKIDLMYWYRLIPVLDMPALLTFCITFFELKRYNARLYRLTWIAAVIFLLYAVVISFLPLMPVLLANQAFALGVFVLATIIGITVGKAGNKLGYYFAAAYSIWFLLILVEAIYIQTGLPTHFSEISYVINQPLTGQIYEAFGNCFPDHWYYGHIHTGAVFNGNGIIGSQEYQTRSDTYPRLRCVGHSAIPMGIAEFEDDRPIEYHVKRKIPNPDPNQVDRVLNGFASLTLSEDGITETMYEVSPTEGLIVGWRG